MLNYNCKALQPPRRINHPRLVVSAITNLLPLRSKSHSFHTPLLERSTLSYRHLHLLWPDQVLFPPNKYHEPQGSAQPPSADVTRLRCTLCASCPSPCRRRSTSWGLTRLGWMSLDQDSYLIVVRLLPFSFKHDLPLLPFSSLYTYLDHKCSSFHMRACARCHTCSRFIPSPLSLTKVLLFPIRHRAACRRRRSIALFTVC